MIDFKPSQITGRLARMKKTPLVLFALALIAMLIVALAPSRSDAQSVTDKKVYSAIGCELEFPDYTPGSPAGWIPPEEYATGDVLHPPYFVSLGSITGPNATVVSQWNVEVLRFWCPVVRDSVNAGGVPAIVVRTLDSSPTADVRCAAWATSPTGSATATNGWVSTGTAFAGGTRTLTLVLPSAVNGASFAIGCEMRSTSGDMSGLSLLSYIVTESGAD